MGGEGLLNEIMDAVTNRLYELFGDGYEIYTDPVAQGLKEPCFFVRFLEPSETPRIGQRYFRQAGMAIQYLSGEQPEGLREMNRAADLLLDGLEYVTLANGSLVRGTDRSVQMDQDSGLLTVLVSFNQFVIKEKPKEEAMERIEIKKGMVK